MDLRTTQLKDTYGNLVTIGSVEGAPTTGTLQNGQGADITSLTIAGTTIVLDSPNQAFLMLDRGDNSNYAINRFYTAGTEEWRLGTINDATDNFYLTGGATADTKMITVRSTGDISFRDGSANEAFYWDASAGSLGLGTQTPDALLHIESNGSSVIRLTDNDATVEDGSIAGKIEFENNDSSGGLNAYIAGINEGVAGDIGLSFATGAGGSATERMRIDSNGVLQIRGDFAGTGQNPTMQFYNTDTSLGSSQILGDLDWYQSDSSGSGVGVVAKIRGINESSFQGEAGLSFFTGTTSGLTERMRIDSSGNVGIGTTSPTQKLHINKALSSLARFTTTTTGANDSDGVAIGYDDSIGGIFWNRESSNIAFATNNIERMRIDVSGNIIPGTDDSQDLGSVTKRFDDVYATNGTIQTSDRNEKQDIEELDDAEIRVAQKAKTLLRKFRWSSSVEEKGDEARIHFGIIAQDLEQAFTDEGLDAGRYGMFIKSTWTNEDGEEQTRLGVRYNQLLAFIISAL